MNVLDIFRKQKDGYGLTASTLTSEAQAVIDSRNDESDRQRIAKRVLADYIEKEAEHESRYGGMPRYKKDAMRLIQKNYKGRIVFHGGCLSCKITETMGISECYDCFYYQWTTGDIGVPDRDVFKDKSDMSPTEAFKEEFPEYFI